MLRNSSGLASWGRVLLACSLCALAVAFALEAKMAWYGPSHGPVQDIRSAKAMPADTPALAIQRIHIDHPAPIAPELKWLAAFSAVIIAAASGRAAGVLESRVQGGNRTAVFLRPYFSPPHFYRPPPSSL